ncbi:putative toxin-antitoxin system toxin component, PIN family [Candidatus Daviesbacteria bacterium]|nr:putative toxin-antitoxin system toxin component, PIN family [Candidatus Daviesbacteria bacterium]
MRSRVFFDASIIIEALLSKTGGSSLLIQYIKMGKIIGITSQTVIGEVLEEDKPKKFKRSREEIERFITQSGLLIREAIAMEEIAPYKDLVDIEDAHLIAGSNLTKCNYLVTLDKKHLLREDIKMRFLPLKIVSPKQLLEEIIIW